MTVFVWVDENGAWRVTHLPPTDGSAYLRLMVTDMPVFLNEDHEEVAVEVR